MYAATSAAHQVRRQARRHFCTTRVGYVREVLPPLLLGDRAQMQNRDSLITNAVTRLVIKRRTLRLEQVQREVGGRSGQGAGSRVGKRQQRQPATQGPAHLNHI